MTKTLRRSVLDGRSTECSVLRMEPILRSIKHRKKDSVSETEWTRVSGRGWVWRSRGQKTENFLDHSKLLMILIVARSRWKFLAVKWLQSICYERSLWLLRAECVEQDEWERAKARRLDWRALQKSKIWFWHGPERDSGNNSRDRERQLGSAQVKMEIKEDFFTHAINSSESLFCSKLYVRH